MAREQRRAIAARMQEQGLRECRKCGKVKPVDQFYSGRRSCKTCNIAEALARRAKKLGPNNTLARRVIEPIESGFKRCSKCAENKPLDRFYRDAAGTDGRRPKCKACDNKSTASWRRARYVAKTGRRNDMTPEAKVRRAKIREGRDQRRATRVELQERGLRACSRCGEIKPLDEFNRQARGRGGRASHCRLCNRVLCRQSSGRELAQ
jgi:ribosomal protein L32